MPRLLVLSVLVARARALSPSWAELEARLPSSRAPGPAVLGADAATEDALAGRTVLYRDRDGWCPYCERVWLALEAKRADCVTVLVDDHDYDDLSSLPRVRWPDGSEMGPGDVAAILQRVEDEHPDRGPAFFPVVSASVAVVRDSFERFHGIMPRFTRASALAPFVFITRIQRAGVVEVEELDPSRLEIVPRFKYSVSLEEVDEILGEYEDGPFIAGKHVTAADIFWAPFLERLAAHVPALHGGLAPRSEQFEELEAWFDAMDARLPCYAARVKGRSATWARVLAAAHPELSLQDVAGSDTLFDSILPGAAADLPAGRSFDAGRVWAAYADGRAHVADTPAEEVAAFIVRHRDEVGARVAGAAAAAGGDGARDADGADEALRELCAALAGWEPGAAAPPLAARAREAAAFLEREGLAVPRDVGVIPAEALRSFVACCEDA